MLLWFMVVAGCLSLFVLSLFVGWLVENFGGVEEEEDGQGLS